MSHCAAPHWRWNQRSLRQRISSATRDDQPRRFTTAAAETPWFGSSAVVCLRDVTAARLLSSRRRRGPVALRPRVSSGVLFHQGATVYGRRFRRSIGTFLPIRRPPCWPKLGWWNRTAVGRGARHVLACGLDAERRARDEKPLERAQVVERHIAGAGLETRGPAL